MRIQNYDAAVVGAGPIGLFVANKIAEKNHKVVVFEKNKQIGAPMNCAGLITARIFEDFNIPKKDSIQNKIKGAHIHSPSDNILSVGGDKTRALVIDRIKFDRNIAEMAKQEKVEILTNNKIDKISRKTEGLKLKNSKKTNFFCKLLIGADGPFSTVRKSFEMPEPKEFLYSAGAQVTNVNLEPGFVHIFVGNKVAPGFFAWIIPTNKKGTNARVGLCTNKTADYSPRQYLDAFFKNKHSSKILKNAKIEKRLGGAIPIGFIKRNVLDNVMLVGDAAAHVKPTSGGGIFPGLYCANLCSQIANKSIKNNNFSSDFLKEYQKACLETIGKELSKGMRLRSAFKKLSDKKIDKYISNFTDERIIEIINTYGDIDFPSKLVKPLLKKTPLLLKFLLK